jgi:DNA-binding HxlR family transcriptional regulator
MLDIFKALANSYRLKIVELLYEKERRPPDFESELGLTRGGLERHLKQLVDCGLVEKDNFIEEGRAKVKYSLSEESQEFFKKTRILVKKFLKARKTPQDKRERIKLLENKVRTLYDSIEEVNKLHLDNQITEKEYLTVKERYLRELIEIEREMAELLEAR